MKVVLAGYNIEAEQAGRLEEYSGEIVTPEVISAAYARISRDPRSIGALRREARGAVEKARRSNEKIIFGLGHSSVAEHAVFNFDVMGISRLAVEELERFRLASFTEKSQRYIRLGKDLIVPAEVRSAGLEREFRRVTVGLHERYRELYEKILERGGGEEVAKEDARYLMPLASSTQIGVTVNARELEYMVSRLGAHPLRELRKLAAELSRQARRHAPSLVRYPEPTEYFNDAPRARREIARSAAARRRRGRAAADVRLVDVTPDGDTRLAAMLIFSSRAISFDRAYRTAKGLTPARRAAIVARTMRHMRAHDGVWREFESIHLLFEIVVSASCFAQIKRHRMATPIVQPYDISLGLSIPDSVRSARSVAMMREAAASSERLYRRIRRGAGPAADYALINAHRRRVMLGLNLRELYHFSRLRSDRHAQWEIRRISDSMCRLAGEKLPAGAALLCGKDRFDERKAALGKNGGD